MPPILIDASQPIVAVHRLLLAGLSVSGTRTAGFFRSSVVLPRRLAALGLLAGLSFDTGSQSVHEADYIGGFFTGRLFNLLAMRFAFDQILDRFFVPILEFVRLEVPLLGFHDVRG